ncbi:MAG: transglutaminase domain-containing protein [Pseudomonadota bacterium]
MGVLLGCFSIAVHALEESSSHKRLSAHFHQTLTKPIPQLESKLEALLSIASNDEEKAWLIYRWVTHHFKHDARLARQVGDPERHSLEALHRLGGGSCAVYANVTHRLMEMAGLQVKTIYGLVKGGPATAVRHGKAVNHVWNAVKINGVWKVVDSTWGAGFVGQQGFKSEHSDLFFLLSPERAVLSHYDQADELGYQRALAVNQTLFSKLPENALYAAAVGLDPKSILDAARRSSNFSLVLTFDLPPNALRVVSAPANGVLERRVQRFVIDSSLFEELMVVQGKSWVPLKKEGKVHSVALVPKLGELLVMGRRPKQLEFEALLGYDVK